MSKSDLIEASGEIVKILKGWIFLIELDSGQEIIGRTCGRLRGTKGFKYFKPMPGMKVHLRLSPYDLSHGMIVKIMADGK